LSNQARHGSCLDAYAVHIVSRASHDGGADPNLNPNPNPSPNPNPNPQQVSRASRDGGRTWSELALVAGNASVRLGNPTAVTLASGRRLTLTLALAQARTLTLTPLFQGRLG
jgi:hypothetical protein